MPLGVPQDGEGGVGGGVYPSQLPQGLAVLLQPLSGSLETVREGQRGEGGGGGEFGLRERRGTRSQEEEVLDLQMNSTRTASGIIHCVQHVVLLFSNNDPSAT